MAGMRTRRVYLEDLGVGHGAEEQARAEGEPLAKDHGVVVTPAKGVVKSAAWLFFFFWMLMLCFHGIKYLRRGIKDKRAVKRKRRKKIDVLVKRG